MHKTVTNKSREQLSIVFDRSARAIKQTFRRAIPNPSEAIRAAEPKQEGLAHYTKISRQCQIPVSNTSGDPRRIAKSKLKLANTRRPRKSGVLLHSPIIWQSLTIRSFNRFVAILTSRRSRKGVLLSGLQQSYHKCRRHRSI